VTDVFDGLVTAAPLTVAQRGSQNCSIRTGSNWPQASSNRRKLVIRHFLKSAEEIDLGIQEIIFLIMMRNYSSF
jgi:hypothetical protein